MICLKTFQSILNFLNCGWAISWICFDLVNEGVVRLFNGVGIGEVGGCSVAFKMHKITLITVILS